MIFVPSFNSRKRKNDKHIKPTGGIIIFYEIIRNLGSASLERASSMKLGGETFVPCFWNVPEQRINFLATMSSTEMNTKLLRKLVRREPL